jgi:hypothetical protein
MGEGLCFVYGKAAQQAGIYLKIRPRFFNRAALFFEWLKDYRRYHGGEKEVKRLNDFDSIESVQVWDIEQYKSFKSWLNNNNASDELSRDILKGKSFNLEISLNGLIEFSHPFRFSSFIQYFDQRYYQRRIAYFWSRILKTEKVIYIGDYTLIDHLYAEFSNNTSEQNIIERNNAWNTILLKLEKHQRIPLEIHKQLTEEEIDYVFAHNCYVYFIDTFEDLVEEKEIMDALDAKYAEEEALWTPELGWP